MINVLNFSLTYFDVAVILLFLSSIIIGYLRGLFITVVNLVRKVIGYFLCFYISANLTPVLYDNFVQPKLVDSISAKIDKIGAQSFLLSFQDTVVGLPEFLKTGADLSVLATESENLANIILFNILEPIFITLIKIVLFILVFLVFFISTGIIISLIKKASDKRDKERGHMSALKKSDKIIGAVLGAMTAFVIVLAATSVLTYISELNGNAQLAEQLQNSVIIPLIREINPFNAITEGLI